MNKNRCSALSNCKYGSRMYVLPFSALKFLVEIFTNYIPLHSG